MTDKRTAKCMCGGVEVQIEGSPAAMAYCHCDSCRSWLGAPIHAATLWPNDHVTVTKGEALLAEFRRTDNSHRNFCTSCGSPVLVRHPSMGMTDVPAGNISDFKFEPSFHVHYAERVMPVRDGLPKFAGMPAADGSGEQIPE